MSTKHLNSFSTLCIPDANRVIRTTGKQFRNIWWKLTVSDCCGVTEVLAHGLESVQRFIVPAFVENYVGNTYSRTENENVAASRMIFHTLQFIAHILLVCIGLEEHYIVVYASFLCVKINHVNLTTKGGCDYWLLVDTEIATCDRGCTFFINHNRLVSISEVPNRDLSVSSAGGCLSHGVVNDSWIYLTLVEAQIRGDLAWVDIPELGRAINGSWDKTFTISQVVQAPNTIWMTIKSLDTSMWVSIPDLDGIIVGSTGISWTANRVSCKGIYWIRMLTILRNWAHLFYCEVLCSSLHERCFSISSEVYHYVCIYIYVCFCLFVYKFKCAIWRKIYQITTLTI